LTKGNSADIVGKIGYYLKCFCETIGFLKVAKHETINQKNVP